METPNHFIQQIVAAQKRGEARGIYSCCSANAYVLEAALLRGKLYHTPVLIESTANQVDQFGGYSGMRPADFYAFVQQLAAKTGIDPSLVLLGGDHLGPLTFAGEPETKAMEKASELIRQYVLAGFTKIHLDTSMRLADDDPGTRLTDRVIARRGAALCRVAEDAYESRRAAHPDAQPPVYIIGSEVPIPGGAQEDDDVGVTSPEACEQTIAAFRSEYAKLNLDQAWERVVGVVVQPGVEFGDSHIMAYDREKARALTSVMGRYPSMVFEGHSTDYQTKKALKNMVEDGVAILKVGPALTFAMREGLLALEYIERELYSGKDAGLSRFREILEGTMLDNPQNWKKHYNGTGTQQRLARTFSFSDRARYYLSEPPIKASIGRLWQNLGGVEIPLTLISQFMPIQFTAVLEGRLQNSPKALLQDRIGNCIDEYLYATGIMN